MFQFEIHGPPIAQKQTRFTCPCGKGRCYDPSAKDKAQMQWQIKPFAPEVPLTGPIELTIAFFIPIPKGVSKAVREQMINRVILPDKKPDEDNLAYLVTNALKEIVYDDDKRVCAKHVYKFYGLEPKTVIRVRPILQAQPVGYRSADDI
jgi:Holliday junction resolvase RusA-like endonuclease